MENQTNAKQDCGCSDGCCTPKKKSSLWTKLIFIVIIVAAGVIITVKLVGKNEIPPVKSTDSLTSKNVSCADSANKKSCAKVCDPSKGSSCCSQSKK